MIAMQSAVYFFQQQLYQTRHAILVKVFFSDPEVAVGQRWPFGGLPQVEVSIDDAVGKDMAYVTLD